MPGRRNAAPGSPSSRTDTSAGRSIAAALHVDQRTLQCALGAVWVIDGLLKFQPDLFKSSFVSDVISPMAAGQPSLVASAINHTATLLAHGTTVWVALFGLIEIAIGVGLLFRRSVKPALMVSFVWGVGIYLFGEGFGMVLTGQTSPLQGAPGAVCFYMLLGVLVWPKVDRSDDRARTGAESSAAGRGLLGGTGSLLAWAAIWLFEAIIWLFPSNRTANAITGQLTDTAKGEPGWYAHFLTSTGHAFAGTGIWMAAILATVSVIIGLGPLVSRRSGVYIALGIALALFYWVTGEGLGELLTFGGTDPSNGPIIALIGLSLLPLVPEPADDPTPAARFLAANPLGALGAVLAVILIPSVVAVIPSSSSAAASASSSSSSSSSMSGMNMTGSSSMKGMSMTPSGKSSKTGGGASSMNMSGMAGLDVTDPNWKYTGPPLPAAEVARLTTVSATTDEGHKMQTPSCDAKPSSEDVLGATQYVQATSAAVAKYRDLSVAKAAGYVPITNPNYPVVHYLNPAYMNMKDVLNPTTVDSLVYATTPYGPVLVAAMYLMPGPGNGPMPYGCLVQWHAHTNLCTSATTHQIDGFTPCRARLVPLRLDADDDPRLAGARVRRSSGDRSIRPSGGGGGDHGSAARTGSDDERVAAYLIGVCWADKEISTAGSRAAYRARTSTPRRLASVIATRLARAESRERSFRERSLTRTAISSSKVVVSRSISARPAAVMLTCTLRPSRAEAVRRTRPRSWARSTNPVMLDLSS